MPGNLPRILMRADARPELGGGHIMRCLSLARALTDRGASVAFACAPRSADLVPALIRAGLPVLDATRPGDAPFPSGWTHGPDAILLDLYDSTAADETGMRAFAPVIAAIEDLPDRKHDCDLLIDQGFGRDQDTYAGRVPADCVLLLGPDIVPLRPEFTRLRQRSISRRRSSTGIDRLLIAMGLTDVGGITSRIVRTARRALPECEIDVVIGPSAQSRQELERLAAADPRLTVAVDVDDIAERMCAADLAIGAGGGTALERCVLGLPSIVVVLADNQLPAAKALDELGAARMVSLDDAFDDTLLTCLQTVNPDALTALSVAAAKACDGDGANRIADALLGLVSRARSRPGNRG